MIVVVSGDGSAVSPDTNIICATVPAVSKCSIFVLVIFQIGPHIERVYAELRTELLQWGTDNKKFKTVLRAAYSANSTPL